LRLIAAIAAAATLLIFAAPGQAQPQSLAQRMQAIIYTEFGHGWVGQEFVRCAYRETGHTWNPRSANYHDSHGGSFGLLQLNGAHAPGGWASPSFILAMFNPWQNVRLAHRLYNGALHDYGNGFQRWGGGC
jgi:hypothetical protein